MMRGSRYGTKLDWAAQAEPVRKGADRFQMFVLVWRGPYGLVVLHAGTARGVVTYYKRNNPTRTNDLEDWRVWNTLQPWPKGLYYLEL